MRLGDVPELRRDASKARGALRWEPETSFEELVRIIAWGMWRGMSRGGSNNDTGCRRSGSIVIEDVTGVHGAERAGVCI